MEEFFVDGTVENSRFSDHDAARIEIGKNAFYFYTFL